MVESGAKTQTIRKVRKYPIKVGDTLYLNTGMRTKQFRRLRETECTGVKGIHIIRGGIIDVHLGFVRQNTRQCLELALADGFIDFKSFVKFFEDKYGLPFEGVLIKWD